MHEETQWDGDNMRKEAFSLNGKEEKLIRKNPAGEDQDNPAGDNYYSESKK